MSEREQHNKVLLPYLFLNKYCWIIGTKYRKVRNFNSEEMIIVYTEHELKELRKAIYEFTADQLMWEILYINAVAQHSPALDVVRNKLLSLPKTFGLIMQNSVRSPDVKKLTQAVNQGTQLFIQYVNCVFQGGTDATVLKQKLSENIELIAKCLHQINAQWGTQQWMTLIQHQVELTDAVMDSAKQGKYETWENILPIIRKLKMDMADYLAQGICDLNP